MQSQARPKINTDRKDRAMSANFMTTCKSVLRLRRNLDIDAVTVWMGVMGFLTFASAAALMAA